MCQSPTEDKTIEVLMEQWKLFVEMTDRVSSRRVNAGKLYVSLLTGLLAVVSLVLQRGTPLVVQKTAFIAIGFMGLALCGIWVVNIRSYKQLNSLKFQVIQEMETSLPFPCYTREWQILKDGKSKKGYLRLSRIEQYIPIFLMVPYVILIIFSFLYL